MITGITGDFLLEIPGDLRRYYSGRVPEAATPTNSPGGVDFIDVEAIIGVSGISSSIEEIGGVAEVGGVSVTLATGGALAEGEDDAGVVLTRLGFREADWSAQIQSSLRADDAGPIYVDTDPSPLSTPLWVNVGTEAILVTATAGTQPNPDVADPYRLTVGARGAGDTQPQNHIRKFRGAAHPTITTPIVYWQGRRAILSRWDGRQYTQIMRGFLGATPQIGADGLSVQVQLLPLMIRLDRELATDSSIEPFGLLDGWHFFEDETYLESAEVLLRGRAISGTINTATVIASQVLPGMVSLKLGDYHGDIFDITRPNGCPRQGEMALRYHGTTDVMKVIAPYPAGGQDLKVEVGAPTIVAASGSAVDNETTAELLRATVAAGLIRVPDDLAVAINADWAPGVLTGNDGAWMDIKLRPDRADLLVKWNTSGACRGDAEIWLWGRRPYSEEGSALRPSAIRRVDATGVPTFPRAIDERMWAGVDLRDPEDESPADGLWLRRLEVPASIDDQYSIPIRGVFTSWYSPGEEGLLVNDNPIIPADGLTLEIIHEDDNGDEILSFAKVLSSSVKGDGWLLELDAASQRDLPVIRNGRGRSEVVIRPGRATDGLDPGIILLQLLLSGGDGSSSYDVLPVGAGLMEDEVDLGSCLRLTPSVEGLWSLILPESTPIKELIQGILLDCGAALVLHSGGDGAQRVAAVSVAPEVTTELRAAWSEFKDTPSVLVIDDVRTAYQVGVDFNREDTAQSVLIVEDPAAAQRIGRERTLSVDLRGKHLALPRSGSALSAVLPIATRLAAIYGAARRRYTVRLAAEQVESVGLGDVVSITDPHVRGPYPARRRFGVTDLGGRISSLEIDWWNGEATASLVSYGGKRGGWAPSIRVLSVVSATKITVETLFYGSDENAYTGEEQDDLTPFAEGDTVRAVVETDSGVEYQLVIQTIDLIASPKTITFTTAHPYVHPDYGWIQPAKWDSAEVGHKLFAYMADAAGGLGAVPVVDGFEVG